MTIRILHGDCRHILSTLPAKSVHTCVTSPPYFNLRSYLADDDPMKRHEIGSEATPEEFVATIVEVFREVRRVLRDDGTIWVNLGDAYASRPNGSVGKESGLDGSFTAHTEYRKAHALRKKSLPPGLKHKDLIGIPWKVAFALQADGWWLRRDIIWHKLNPMPESVKDRPTCSHEYIFLLTKSLNYYYDADAIKEPVTGGAHARKPGPNSLQNKDRTPVSRKAEAGITPKTADPSSRIKSNSSFHAATGHLVDTRNKRTVWSVGSEAFSGEHWAVFPPALIEPCILAGAPRGGVVLDPFAGAGTTGLVADRHGRDAILIDLDHRSTAMAASRITSDSPLFSNIEAT